MYLARHHNTLTNQTTEIYCQTALLWQMESGFEISSPLIFKLNWGLLTITEARETGRDKPIKTPDY